VRLHLHPKPQERGTIPRENPNLTDLLVLMLHELELKEKEREKLVTEITAVQELIVLLELIDLLVKERRELIGRELIGRKLIGREKKAILELESAFMIEDLELEEVKRSRKEVVEEAIGERRLRETGMNLLKKTQKKPLQLPQLKELRPLLMLRRLRKQSKKLLVN